MSDLIRVGCVSKINYEEGTIEVTYPDRDDAVTDPFPVLSFNDEYKMPDIGQDVLVLHLSNGSALGIVLGPYWNKDNKPAASGKDVYRKEMAQKPGKAYTQYKDGTVELRGPAVRLTCSSGSITVAQLLAMKSKVDSL
jgi:phage baseplate assembly protein gpV